MRQVILYCLSIVFSLFMSSCHEDKEFENILWSQEASVVIKDGISFTHDKAEIILKFNTMNADISVSSSEAWIDASIAMTESNGELNIHISENPGISSREGIVAVHSNDETTLIRITQKGAPRVIPENNSYYHHHGEGEITVKVEAGSLPVAEIYPENTDWIKVGKITADDKNKYTITLIVEKNEGLGRIASLDFKIDEQPAIKGSGPCIIQEPASFNENIEISVDKPGSLQILLGNESANLNHIRFLKIKGPVNGLDFPVIKSLFSNTENSYGQQPIRLDLSESVIVAGDKNPFEYYGWKPSKKYEDIYLYGEIPANIFTNAVNLKEIRLPEGLKIIGAFAFKGCKNLSKVQIPDSVEEINSKAFYGCLKMEDIQLNHNSNLLSIGNQAFTTGPLLKDLTIPTTVTNISGEAFLGCTVSRLHLKWQEPYEVRIVPKTEGCSLFVPKGTSELYRNTRNWCNFKEIIEE